MISISIVVFVVFYFVFVLGCVVRENSAPFLFGGMAESVTLLCAQIHIDRSNAKVLCDAGSSPATTTNH